MVSPSEPEPKTHKQHDQKDQGDIKGQRQYEVSGSDMYYCRVRKGDKGYWPTVEIEHWVREINYSMALDLASS
jgi:hypothetical protein